MSISTVTNYSINSLHEYKEIKKENISKKEDYSDIKNNFEFRDKITTIYNNTDLSFIAKQEIIIHLFKKKPIFVSEKVILDHHNLMINTLLECKLAKENEDYYVSVFSNFYQSIQKNISFYLLEQLSTALNAIKINDYEMFKIKINLLNISKTPNHCEYSLECRIPIEINNHNKIHTKIDIFNINIVSSNFNFNLATDIINSHIKLFLKKELLSQLFTNKTFFLNKIQFDNIFFIQKENNELNKFIQINLFINFKKHVNDNTINTFFSALKMSSLNEVEKENIIEKIINDKDFHTYNELIIPKLLNYIASSKLNYFLEKNYFKLSKDNVYKSLNEDQLLNLIAKTITNQEITQKLKEKTIKTIYNLFESLITEKVFKETILQFKKEPNLIYQFKFIIDIHIKMKSFSLSKDLLSYIITILDIEDKQDDHDYIKEITNSVYNNKLSLLETLYTNNLLTFSKEEINQIEKKIDSINEKNIKKLTYLSQLYVHFNNYYHIDTIIKFTHKILNDYKLTCFEKKDLLTTIYNSKKQEITIDILINEKIKINKSILHPNFKDELIYSLYENNHHLSLIDIVESDIIQKNILTQSLLSFLNNAPNERILKEISTVYCSNLNAKFKYNCFKLLKNKLHKKFDTLLKEVNDKNRYSLSKKVFFLHECLDTLDIIERINNLWDSSLDQKEKINLTLDYFIRLNSKFCMNLIVQSNIEKKDQFSEKFCSLNKEKLSNQEIINELNKIWCSNLQITIKNNLSALFFNYFQRKITNKMILNSLLPNEIKYRYIEKRCYLQINYSNQEIQEECNALNESNLECKKKNILVDQLYNQHKNKFNMKLILTIDFPLKHNLLKKLCYFDETLSETDILENLHTLQKSRLNPLFLYEFYIKLLETYQRVLSKENLINAQNTIFKSIELSPEITKEKKKEFLFSLIYKIQETKHNLKATILNSNYLTKNEKKQLYPKPSLLSCFNKKVASNN